MPVDQQDGRSWRAWIQDNFTMLTLLMILLISFGVTIFIMHETWIPDEYAKWSQGWTAGILSSLTLAMNRTAEKPHPLAPGTMEPTLRVEPPAPAVTARPAEEKP